MFVILFFGFNMHGLKAQCSVSYTSSYDSISGSIDFTAVAISGNPISYFWDFGDSSSSTLANPSHAYNFMGGVVVCLTVGYSSGCFADYCDSIITMPNVPTCSAQFTYTNSPAGTSFTNYSNTGGISYSSTWDFGDGTTGTGNNPDHTFPANGNYNVCLTVTSFLGCSSTSCQNVFAQISGFNCAADFNFSAVPGSTIVDFTDISTADSSVIVSYSWSFGDSSSSTLPNPSHVYASPGTYIACLQIETAAGCSSFNCHSVYVGNGNPCQAGFTYSANPATNNIDFYDQSTTSDSIVSWAWTFGDGDSLVGFNPSHHYALPGNYTVCLTVVSASGCYSTICNNINVPPVAGCTAHFTPQVSGSTSVFYADYNSASASYTWDFGDGSTITQIGSPVITHIYPLNANYIACLIIQDSTCSATYCDSINIGNSLVCSALFGYSVDSTGMIVSFTNYSSPATNYFWSFGDGTSSIQMNPVHTFSQVGPHTVCLTMTDSASGCSDTFCNQVSASNACNPVFSVQPDSANVLGVAMTFSVYSPCGVPSSITYSFGDGTIITSNSSVVTYNYATPGTYYVCVCEIIGMDTLCFCDTIVAYRLGNGIGEEEMLHLNLSTYPNPFSSNLNIEYFLVKNSAVQIQLIGIAGNVVESFSDEKLTSGKQHQVMNTTNLSNGFYILNMNVNGNKISRKVVLQR